MANNGGRQCGGVNQTINEHVEFTVKAEEDLYLTGSENTIRRVTAETNYSCLMLKTQRFSSLFRHYAKYHGLRKEDLEYYFVNPLENDDTPESIQLQRADTIMVRKRRKPHTPIAASNDEEFFKDMKDLLDDDEHMDAVFVVHGDQLAKPASAPVLHQTITRRNTLVPKSLKLLKEMSDQKENKILDTKLTSERKYKSDDSCPVQIRAHKSILTARAEYFKALFRKSCGTMGSINMAFNESSECFINVDSIFSAKIINLMLEFIYTNRIQCIQEVITDDLLSLLHLSDTWLLRDLKRLVEYELIQNHINIDKVARLYCATEEYNANRLQRACINFIMENIREVTGSVLFQEEMKHYTNLCIPILKAAADLIPEPVHKKQRTNDTTTCCISTQNIATSISSPLPQSDV